ncbi:hypothetical protein BGZ60DRAFT_527486 [Tricladium varicosporioides]|nr:hypothetical protein BGZ60DRAFT_527486 [Hymenoscyphus varicosporioides]
MNEEAKRAERLRDNKRRNRQRQRDYTTGLEKKLKELQVQGVQATKEVQVSARRVVEDNVRLRALLSCIGVEDHVIETWRPGDDISPVMYGGKGEGRQCEWKDGLLHSTCLPVTLKAVPISISDPERSTGTTENWISIPSVQEQSSISQPQQAKKLCAKPCSNPSIILPSIRESPSTTSPPKLLQLPPCKVLTRLTDNPNQDITQSPSPITASVIDQEQENDGVDCHQAHAMLMQFATSEEKLDVISQALERGCVGKKSGGCKVRNEEIWRAMDDVT